MKLKREHKRMARILWNESFVNGVPDFSVVGERLEQLRNINNRYKEFIFVALLERIQVYLREHKLRIISPGDLDSDRRKKVLSAVGLSGGYTGGIEFAMDPSLIAGLRIEKGYDIEDYSVSKQLGTLRKIFMDN